MCLSEPSEGSPVCTTERVLTVWQPLAAYGAEHTLGKTECMCVVITTIIGLLTCWRQAFAILHMLCTACTSLHTSTKIFVFPKNLREKSKILLGAGTERHGGEGRPESSPAGKGVRRKDQSGREIHPQQVQLQRALPECELAGQGEQDRLSTVVVSCVCE